MGERSCDRCHQPREAGAALCRDCRNAERRDRYQLDPAYRVGEKARNRAWKEANKARVAERQRGRRAVLKESLDTRDS